MSSCAGVLTGVFAGVFAGAFAVEFIRRSGIAKKTKAALDDAKAAFLEGYRSIESEEPMAENGAG